MSDEGGEGRDERGAEAVLRNEIEKNETRCEDYAVRSHAARYEQHPEADDARNFDEVGYGVQPDTAERDNDDGGRGYEACADGSFAEYERADYGKRHSYVFGHSDTRFV